MPFQLRRVGFDVEFVLFGDDGGVRGERCRRGAVMVAAYVPLVGAAAAEMFAETVFRVPVRAFGGFADAV